MSLFYAYLIYRGVYVDQRWILTFASRAVADEWWRKVEKQNCITRLSPQFYKLNGDDKVLKDSMGDGAFEVHLVKPTGRHSDPDSLPVIIPSIFTTDHISGHTYFIRSQSSPDIYWSLKTDNIIYASRTERTKFRIRIKEGHTDGKVMIGSDDIEIMTAFSIRDEILKINIDSFSNVLIADKKAEPFKFGDFSGGFMVQGGKGPYEFKEKPGEVDQICKADEGEIWELTN